MAAPYLQCRTVDGRVVEAGVSCRESCYLAGRPCYTKVKDGDSSRGEALYGGVMVAAYATYYHEYRNDGDDGDDVDDSNLGGGGGGGCGGGGGGEGDECQGKKGGNHARNVG